VAAEVISFAEELENGTNVRTAEGKRRTLVSKWKTLVPQLRKQPDYKSNHLLVDSLVRYVERTKDLFENEYVQVIRLQDSSVRAFSYERKYLNAKQAVLLQLVENEAWLLAQFQHFGSDYVLAVPKKYEEEYGKLSAIQKVSRHHNVYKAVYAKCAGQEALLAKAIEYRKRSDMEQHSVVLMKYVKESCKVLDTVKAAYEDRNIVQATKDLLDFYKVECEYKIPMLVSFMSRGGEDQRKGKTDIGNNININPHVNVEPHADIATYANTKGDLDEQRPVLLSNWNKASQNFLRKYLPAL